MLRQHSPAFASTHRHTGQSEYSRLRSPGDQDRYGNHATLVAGVESVRYSKFAGLAHSERDHAPPRCPVPRHGTGWAVTARST
jgi:hypothetical protein